MSAKHTPGPWRVEEWRAFPSETAETPQYIVKGADGQRVTEPYRPRSQADARLIAAAPELLAACETMLERLDLEDGLTHTDDRHYRQLLAAVNKAKGKPADCSCRSCDNGRCLCNCGQRAATTLAVPR